MFKVYLPMRNQVMHSKFGEPTARVTKLELRTAFEAIRSYAAHVAAAGGILTFYQELLDRSPLKDLPPERLLKQTPSECERNLRAMNPCRFVVVTIEQHADGHPRRDSIAYRSAMDAFDR